MIIVEHCDSPKVKELLTAFMSVRNDWMEREPATRIVEKLLRRRWATGAFEDWGRDEEGTLGQVVDWNQELWFITIEEFFAPPSYPDDLIGRKVG